MKRKIIFLDIDGVLNNGASRKNYKDGRLCPWNLSNLNHILEKVPTAEIVISSTHRINNTLNQLRERFRKDGGPWEKIVDTTPRAHLSDLIDLDDGKGKYWSQESRGLEIQKWLNTQDVGYMTILDDDSDMGHPHPFLVHTNHSDGLTMSKAQIAISMLETPRETVEKGIHSFISGSRAIWWKEEIVGYAFDVLYQKRIPKKSRITIEAI